MGEAVGEAGQGGEEGGKAKPDENEWAKQQRVLPSSSL